MTVCVGLSGFSVYVPPYRVLLDRWSAWTANDSAKTAAVVGDAFRMCSQYQNVYTMAANAVLKLIVNHGIDPQRIGMLALGTESSTDNSAGAVIVRGMVDRALQSCGLPPIRRSCEVPEFKHACLGGVYAMKAALRYVGFDADGSEAIVVSSDIAEYARGSSGEPTQGAGAVAMWINRGPALLEANLSLSGSASDYRGLDFRKPMSRFRSQRDRPRLQDCPIFNGRYSIVCYLEEIVAAMNAASLRERSALSGTEWDATAYIERFAAVFLHRPYQRMPETGWALLVLSLLAGGSPADRDRLGMISGSAGIPLQALLDELDSAPSIARPALEDGRLIDAYPLSESLIRKCRGNPLLEGLVESKLVLGSVGMRQVGNLYSAALPAWMAAGLEDAARSGADLAGSELLAIGYGSGDAAEVIPFRVVPGWQTRAVLSGFDAALNGAVDLEKQEYERLHDDGFLHEESPPRGFFVDRMGSGGANLEDTGIEYYGFNPFEFSTSEAESDPISAATCSVRL